MPLSGQTMSVTNTYTPGAVITASGFNTNFTDFATSVTTVATALQGDLDANGKNIGFDDLTGIEDDSGNEMLLFDKVASAVNYVVISNAATAGTPFISAAGDDANIGVGIASKGTGTVTLYSGATARILSTFANVASSVNYWQFTPAVTGGGPAMQAVGSDTNIQAVISSKGTGDVALYSGAVSRVLAAFVNVASSVNYWQFSPSATGTAPIMQAVGSDTNIDVRIYSKGTGQIQLYSGDGARALAAFANVASSVNFWTFSPSATGNAIIAAASGTDTNIILRLDGKGTGGVMIEGTATNDSATAGYVGEVISSNIVAASQVSLTTGNGKNVTSIDLTAGDWDVRGNVVFNPAGGTTITQVTAAISATSDTVPTIGLDSPITTIQATLTTGAVQRLAVAAARISVASTTTIYLVAVSSFGASTMGAYGWIQARRAR